jgi:hypothetical protein
MLKFREINYNHNWNKLIADQVILDNHPNMNPNLLIDIREIALQNKRKE